MDLKRDELVIGRPDWTVLQRQAREHGAAYALLGRARLPGGDRWLVARVLTPAEAPPILPAQLGGYLGVLEVLPVCDEGLASQCLAERAVGGVAVALLAHAGHPPRAWRWDPRLGRAVGLAGVRVIGDATAEERPALERFTTASTPSLPLPDRLQRQLAALGAGGQQRLRDLSVAIVGCGGTGGLVAQLLALIGVGRLVLTDDDRIEESNRNRLVSASVTDAARGAWKTHALRRYLRRIAPDVVVATLSRSLYHPRSTRAIVAADLLIGCTDNEGSRLHMNALALQYLAPYIDCGVGILWRGEHLQAGGQVRVVVPGGACLECYGGIDRWRAADDLASPQERALRHAHGYGLGGQPAIALAPLNAVIAAEAAGTVIALVTGLRDLPAYLAYDFLGARMGAHDEARRNPGCPACATGRRFGRGDGLQLPKPAADDDLLLLPEPPSARPVAECVS